MTFAIYETEYRDGDGELIVTERLNRIGTGGAIEDDDGDREREDSDGAGESA